MLCALVCKDFSHGQPDVLHLSCVVENSSPWEELKEKGGGKGRMERETGRNSRVEGGKGMREGEKRGKMYGEGDRTVYPSAVYILRHIMKLCYNWY